MIDDLDETLKHLLIHKGQLSPDEVDISFDIPTREWSKPVARPTVNLYLYDLRENRELRETYWDEEAGEAGKVKLVRRPIRMDLSYMITCWAVASEDQHRLLWRVLEAFFQNSPLPEDVLQGGLRQQIHPVRTQVAQPDGVLKNLSDYWSALDNQLRPSVTLVVTLDLDIEKIRMTPLVFARAVRVGQPALERDALGREVSAGKLAAGWETLPVQLAGIVRDEAGRPVSGAAVRVIGVQKDGRPLQVGATRLTDEAGRYTFSGIPPGEYTLVVEPVGKAPVQQPLLIVAGGTGETFPAFVHEVEVMTK